MKPESSINPSVDTESPGHNSWTSIELGDVCTKIGSGATPRGGKDVYLNEGPYTLIRSQNVYNDGFHREGLAFIGEHHADQLQNVEVLEKDVLLNITGDSVARICQVAPDILPARVNQHVAIIRPDTVNLDPGYLRYYLTSPEMQTMLLSWAGSGGTRNALTKGMIESLEIRLPTMPEQQAIAHILGTLDDKIELNRRVNQTLEAMARAIFHDWFVDFGPVRAKLEGQDPYLPPELWDLFPDDLVDSELGDIPEGWEVKALDRIADYQNGLALQRFRPGDNEERLPSVKIAQLRTGRADGGEWAKATIRPECIIDDGDVIFSWSGSLMIKVWCGGRAALNQHLFKVTSKTCPKWFYFQRIGSHLSGFQSIAADKTTTMGHIKREHLSSARCVVPSQPLLKAADEILGPLFTRQVSVNLRSNALESQRDTLLPKLISGEIEVG